MITQNESNLSNIDT